MRNEDKLIVTVIILAALFAFYDIGHRMYNHTVHLNEEKNETVVSQVTNDKPENKDNYRLNKHDRLLSMQGLRDYGRYTDNLKYDIADKLNDRLPKKFDNDLIVRFVINEDGKIDCCKIESSSGNKNADDILTKSISKLNPYKPLPAEHLGSGLSVKLTYGADGTTGFQSQPVYY